MLRCIAVDDEPLALELLSSYIRKLPFLELVSTCGDAFEATEALQKNRIDLMFADIQMPGLTGIQFVQSLVNRPMVIFVTAYKKFALEGFDLDVVDYLLKPVSLERFMKACHKAQELHQLRVAPANASPQFFFLNVDYSLVKVMFDDITWIEVSGDYVKIYLKSAAKPLLVRISARALEADLPADRFIRIHKSYIVAIASVTAVRKNSLFIKEMELPVGETYREAVRQLTRRDV